MNESTMSWVVLLGLGAFHGLNPGMGWLFAVALGMQERRRGAVLGALLPLGIGHALAVAVAVAAAMIAGVVIPINWLHWILAGTLISLGITRFFSHRHPRWASMRVNKGTLTFWSFLMASAHGAGLMVVPVFLSMPMGSGHCHAMAGSTMTSTTALLATVVHAVGYLVVTAVISVVVFEKVGVGVLRKAWFNLDLVWATTLLATGVVCIFL